MSPPTSRQQFDVLEIGGAEEVLSPGRYPRALYYPDDGGLALFPAGDRRHTLRMTVAEFAETDDGRAVALGTLGTKVLLAQRRRRKKNFPTRRTHGRTLDESAN